MADVKVLRLYKPFGSTTNITFENGCLCYYCDGELIELLCKPHLAEYAIVEVHESVVKETDPMCSPFSCEEEQIHYEHIFDFLYDYEHYITKEKYEELAAQRFEDLYKYFEERGGGC